MTKSVKGRSSGARASTYRVLGSEDVKRFGKAAKTFSGKANASEKSALDTLIALGTHTSKGKITKRYSK